MTRRNQLKPWSRQWKSYPRQSDNHWTIICKQSHSTTQNGNCHCYHCCWYCCRYGCPAAHATAGGPWKRSWAPALIPSGWGTDEDKGINEQTLLKQLVLVEPMISCQIGWWKPTKNDNNGQQRGIITSSEAVLPSLGSWYGITGNDADIPTAVLVTMPKKLV